MGRFSVVSRRRDTPDFTDLLDGYELPSFSSTVTQALDALHEPEPDMAAVAAIIRSDPGISARVLRLVNSASYGIRSTATNVQQAAMLLGRNQLEALLLSVGAREALPKPKARGFDDQRFWMTSTTRAILAGMFAGQLDPTRRSENFTAALLQDMAIPVLASRAAGYPDVLEEWHETGADLADLEAGRFGWHHGEVASWMGRQWELPEHYTDFMADHHDTGEDGLLPAHLVAHLREHDADGASEDAVIAAAADVGIDADMARAMIRAAEEEAKALGPL